MLLVYTHKITPRFTYIMRHVFTRMLGIEVAFSIKVEDFIKHTGPKITYTKQPLQNEFFVRSNDLLFQQGINDVDLIVSDWDGVPCFFRVGEGSSVPFDIFSASFYLLSRYEEYLPHVKDSYGRFPAKESVAFKNNFLHLPVVDLWAQKLLASLQEKFPDILAKTRTYNYISIIDVTSSHCFAYRGVMRSMAGLVVDLAQFKFKRLITRVGVWFGKNDPYDNFDALVQLHKKYKTKSMMFFQFASYSTYDKNVSTTNNKFRFLIKSMADYSDVSLIASYSSLQDKSLLKKEKHNLTQVLNRPLVKSRMRYNRIDVPKTYRHLVESEFTDDYTMGYTHFVGFKASTCTPFFFYDINLELQQPIKIHSFAVHDYALVGNSNKAENLANLDTLVTHVKSIGGELISVFSNELLGDDNLQLYTSIIKKQDGQK